jgi:hypothetical protein
MNEQAISPQGVSLITSGKNTLYNQESPIRSDSKLRTISDNPMQPRLIQKSILPLPDEIPEVVSHLESKSMTQIGKSFKPMKSKQLSKQDEILIKTLQIHVGELSPKSLAKNDSLVGWSVISLSPPKETEQKNLAVQTRESQLNGSRSGISLLPP